MPETSLKPSRTCAFAAFLLTVLLALFALGSARANAAEPGVVGDLTWFPDEADRERSATVMQDLGSKWVRLDIGWHDFEPSKGNYSSWALNAYEQEFRRAKAAGQKVIAMVHTTPDWANGSTNMHTPPSNPADYADFMRFVSGRYGEWVDAWEIWNEQNYSRFWTNPSPAAYTRLLKAAYPAVKAGDPTAPVVFGGLSTNDYEFVAGAYAAGAKGYFDVMATHPYSCDRSPETIQRYSNGRMTKGSFPAYREVRATMLANDDPKPIWFTEFGWTTSTTGCGVSEATQADYLTRAFRYLEGDPYVQVATWYNMRNSWWYNDADQEAARYGLLKSDFTPKPAYTAFRNYATGASDPLPPPTSDSGGRKKKRWLRLSARGSSRVRVTGRVSTAVTRVKLTLYRRSDGRWSRIDRSAVRVRSGRIAARMRAGSAPGRLRVRAAAAGRRDLRPVLGRVRT